MRQEPENTKVRDGVGDIVPHGPVYHWRNGWYFCRGECNVVHIWNVERGIELEMTESEWDSLAQFLRVRD